MPTRAQSAQPRSTAKSLALVIIASVFILASASPAQQDQSKPQSSYAGPFSINISVDEVVLHVTVRNRHGTPVAGLNKEDFQVFESGGRQSIRHFSHEDIPVTVGLVIDNSGSMRPKRAEVVAAALAFAGSSNPQDEMFLVNFNEHVSFGLPSGMPFTDRSEQLKTAMGSVKADGETALYDAVAMALDHLKKGHRDKRVLIVVSDGADNASVHTKAQVLKLITESDAIVYGLGIYEHDDPDRNPRVLSDLAKASGGEAFFPEVVQNVLPICERIAREIRNQYTLAFISTNTKHDGTYRHVQVRVRSPKGASVTTRPGYVAPLAESGNAASQSKERN
jgi:Ca-activated chloride channel family protein